MKRTDSSTKAFYTIEICVEPDDDGFHAYCPALKGLHTGGHTRDEAIANVKVGARTYIQSLVKRGEPLPSGVTRAALGSRPKGCSARTTRVIETLALATP